MRVQSNFPTDYGNGLFELIEENTKKWEKVFGENKSDMNPNFWVDDFTEEQEEEIRRMFEDNDIYGE